MAFDIIVGLILAAYLIQGLRKGFFTEVMGLAGVIGGILAGIIGAGALGRRLSEVLPDFFGKEIVALILCFAALFIVVYLVARKVGGFFTNLSEKLYLKGFDRVLGGVVGALKGGFILSLILMFISFTALQKPLKPYQKDSFFHKPLYNLVPQLYKHLGSPEELPEAVKEILNQSRDQFLDDATKELKKDIQDAID